MNCTYNISFSTLFQCNQYGFLFAIKTASLWRPLKFSKIIYIFSIEIHFNHEIQYLSIATLCSINDTETLRMITNFITIRIDNIFKNKQRYHGNSALHRILQTTLQHILLLVLKNGELKNILLWCLDMMVKLPHQPSVRICFEWFVSLYFYIQVSLVFFFLTPNFCGQKLLWLSSSTDIAMLLKDREESGIY